MVLMARRGRGSTSTTEFGWTLKVLMGKKRVEATRELSDLLTDHDYPVSQQMISNYMRGRNRVPAGFVSALIEALDLNDEEQDMLSRAWADTLPDGEQNVVLRAQGARVPTQENLERAGEFERRVGERQEEGEGPDDGAGDRGV